MERNGGGTWTPDPGAQNHLQGPSVVLGLVGTQGAVLSGKRRRWSAHPGRGLLGWRPAILAPSKAHAWPTKGLDDAEHEPRVADDLAAQRPLRPGAGPGWPGWRFPGRWPGAMASSASSTVRPSGRAMRALTWIPWRLGLPEVGEKHGVQYRLAAPMHRPVLVQPGLGGVNHSPWPPAWFLPGPPARWRSAGGGANRGAPGAPAPRRLVDGLDAGPAWRPPGFAAAFGRFGPQCLALDLLEKQIDQEIGAAAHQHQAVQDDGGLEGRSRQRTSRLA